MRSPSPSRFPEFRNYRQGRESQNIISPFSTLVFGIYRRHMKVISYLDTFDRLLEVAVTTQLEYHHRDRQGTGSRRVLINARIKLFPHCVAFKALLEWS